MSNPPANPQRSRRPRSRSRRRQGGDDLSRLMQQMALAANAGRRRSTSRRKRSRSRSRARGGLSSTSVGSSSAGGEISVNFTEILTTVKIPVNATTAGIAIDIRPGGTGNNAAHLANLGKLYERMQWHSFSAHYTGTVGTTEGGVVIMGFDYDKDTPALSMATVGVMQPNVTVAAWDKATLSVPVSRLAPQKWMSTEQGDEAPHGHLCIFVSGSKLTGQDVGFIRLSYKVSFAGPKKI